MLTKQRRGGEFLYEPVEPDDVLTPERLTPEQRLVARSADEFVAQRVRPSLEALENQDWELNRRLIREAGELGFLGIELPAEYGGLGLDKVTSTRVGQAMAPGASFLITFAVQTGIGMLPIAYFGTPEQKRTYLPSLIAGERVAAYSLTEPGSGSDALGARTTARLSADGRHYVLNGVKQWTSNAGFADVFIVFAKIDGEQFSAFIVERGYPGVSVGAEENKMGLKGSSTAQVILSDARVPAENLLHFPGKGHQVAFNLLNLGRFGLAAGSTGACRHLLGVSTRYALERRQFGRPIASFGLIRQKLAGMAARTYAIESLTYRLAGLLEEAQRGLDLTGDVRDEAARRLAEYAIECSIAKVHGTESLRDVVDEGVQIHGGYGFMHGYDVERTYRDCRIFRIFEGTNEINRLLIPETLLRRVQRGELPPVDPAEKIRAVLSGGGAPARADSPLGAEERLVAAGRDLFWLVLALALRKHGRALDEQQEVLALAGDLAIETLAMESTVARANQSQAAADVSALHRDLARSYVAGAARRLGPWARDAIAYLAEPSEHPALLAAIERRLAADPIDQVSIGRRIADRVVAAEGWPLD